MASKQSGKKSKSSKQIAPPPEVPSESTGAPRILQFTEAGKIRARNGRLRGGGAVVPGPFRGGGSVGGGGPFGFSSQYSHEGRLKNGGAVGGGGPFRSERDLASWFGVQPPKGIFGRGLGYLPDLPDRRDRTISNWFSREQDSVRTGPKTLKYLQTLNQSLAGELPEMVNLTVDGYFTPVEDQGPLGSCTAQAVIGLAEYMIHRDCGELMDLSRMFLYKATRNLMGVQGDTGAYIRTTIKAMVAFGVPPEDRWSYAPELLDLEPMAFQYAYASMFRALKYARIDGYDVRPDEVLPLLKGTLAAGFPVAFGFPVHASINSVTPEQLVIPFPGYPLIDGTDEQDDPVLGGHAVLAVGYDDRVETEYHPNPGALIIRNSWGEYWADGGYGYLPYDYVNGGLAMDFWTILSSRWLGDEVFE